MRPEWRRRFPGAGYVESIISSEIDAFSRRIPSAADASPELVVRARYNQELKAGWMDAISDVINSITVISIILAGAALIREREHGTIEHLLVMPVTPFEIMVSKIWSMDLVVLVGVVFALLFVVQGLLSIPLQGSFLLFMVGAILDIFAATCMGIFLATLAGSMPQFGLLLVLVLVLFAIQMLSGGEGAQESMPQVIQIIMLATPNTHLVTPSEAVLLRGASLDVVWPQLAMLLAIGSVLFALAMTRFRRFLR